MPDLKEKLVELIDNFNRNLSPFAGGSRFFMVDDNIEQAEYLIANGVTIQKWIPVSERLPEEEGLYLVAVVNDHERRYSKTAWYHGHGNWFLHQKVTHWQYLPPTPKGE